MRLRPLLMGLLSSTLMIACQISSLPRQRETPSPLPSSSPASPEMWGFASPSVTGTVNATPSLTWLPANPNALNSLPDFKVYLHPDSPLYVGDQISVEVIAPPTIDVNHQAITLSVDTPPRFLASTTFQPYGYESRQQATFYWVWNTSDASASEHTLTFSIPSRGWNWSESIALLPKEDLPLSEREAQWRTVETNCCLIYYISGSAADRDLQYLENLAEDEVASLKTQLPLQPKNPLGIAFIPRVVGQGGFTIQNAMISYLDRNYTAAEVPIILHHELVHVFDGLSGGDFKPTIFMEGLAVYLSGGHYQPEPLLSRAAGLIPMGRYIGLSDLANNFYLEQHEIGYLEAGALVEYMVQRWGWQPFLDFYRDIHHEKDDPQSQSIERALQAHFGISLMELENGFKAKLEEIPVNPTEIEALRALFDLYDTIRAYQQALDPAAFYENGWMVDVKELIQRDIVADYWRHPSGLTNITLETMLANAGKARQDGDTAYQMELTKAVQSVLEKIKAGETQPFAANPLAKTYWEIVNQLSQAGFEVQQIKLEDEEATVFVTKQSNFLIEVQLKLTPHGWEIQSINNNVAIMQP
ncbi:MAG: hypothetical protein ACPL3P_09605 [Anaerolineales bacterium]